MRLPGPPDTPGMPRLQRSASHPLALALLLVPTACVGPTRRGLIAWEHGDFARARELWQPRAEAGDADAQYLLGLAFDEGRGGTEDDVEAARWYALAAEQGHAAAQNNLGLLYHAGSSRYGTRFVAAHRRGTSPLDARGIG